MWDEPYKAKLGQLGLRGYRSAQKSRNACSGLLDAQARTLYSLHTLPRGISRQSWSKALSMPSPLC